jgi:hypothetical protein
MEEHVVSIAVGLSTALLAEIFIEIIKHGGAS